MTGWGGGVRVFGEHEGVRGSKPASNSDKIDFSRVGGVEQDKCDAFNGTRLAKDDARNS